jgi:hypothetical protein
MLSPTTNKMSAEGPGAGYTAIILAGKRPGVDPVANANGETYKAKVKVNGVPGPGCKARVSQCSNSARS